MGIEEDLKMKKFESPVQKAALNILYSGNWLQGIIETELKGFGVSHQQYNVLRILRGQKDKAMNLFEVQERMLSKMSNATRLVEKLRTKGYVTRKECQGNRRKVEIEITNKGLKLLDELDPKIKERQEEVFNKISEKDAEVLSNILDKLRNQ